MRRNTLALLGFTTVMKFVRIKCVVLFYYICGTMYYYYFTCLRVCICVPMCSHACGANRIKYAVAFFFFYIILVVCACMCVCVDAQPSACMRASLDVL